MNRSTRIAGRAFSPWLIALAASSLAGWILVLLGELGTMPLDWCLGASLTGRSAIVSAGTLLALSSPAALIGASAVMCVAMMSPLLASPIHHVLGRNFACRGTRAVLLFVAAYLAVWVAAGVGLQTIALALRSATAARWVAPVLLSGVALLWQASPAKQRFLNRCHRRPELAAFGVAADRDALIFGLSNGSACLGACWALMAFVLVLQPGTGHIIAMATLAVWLYAERLARACPPRWQWRAPLSAARIFSSNAGDWLQRCRPNDLLQQHNNQDAGEQWTHSTTT